MTTKPHCPYINYSILLKYIFLNKNFVGLSLKLNMPFAKSIAVMYTIHFLHNTLKTLKLGKDCFNKYKITN